MRTVGARQRKKTATLRRIEEAGWTLFHEHGYEHTSTRQLAAHANIGVGTFFNYFPQKRALLIHIMCKQLDSAITQALSTTPSSVLGRQLLHLFGALNRCCERQRRVARAFVKEWLFVDGCRREQTSAWTHALIVHIGELIDGAKARGEIATHVPTTDLAQQIFGAYYFSLVTWLGGAVPSPQARDRQLKGALSTCLQAHGYRIATQAA